MADLSRANDSLHRQPYASNRLAVGHFMFFACQFAYSRLRKTVAKGPAPPVAEKTSGMKLPFSISPSPAHGSPYCLRFSASGFL